MTADELYDWIQPKLECGSLRLFVDGNRKGKVPEVVVGIVGGSEAMEAAPDEDIVLAVGNASAIGTMLEKVLPRHWEVKY